MLTIVSSTPQEQEHDVVRDKTIEITFSHELHDSSLIADYFKIYLMPGWAGILPCSISKVGNVVKLVPTQNLTANTEYAIWIRGDRNLVDETYEGVTSIIGDVMDGNQIINFTSGDQLQSEIDTNIDTGGYDPVPDSGLPITTPEEQQRIYEQNTSLDVVRTVPADGTSQLEDVSSISIVFDQNVEIEPGYGISGVTVSAMPFIFGETAVVPEITDVSTNGMTLTIETDNNISGNTEYTFTLARDSILGHKQEKLVEDYTWWYHTLLDPFYSSVFLVRHRGGWLIPSELPDSTIEVYIFEASIWVVEEVLQLAAYPTGDIPKIITKIVTCKAIYDIAIGISSGKLKGIKEKTLADLRIVYDKSGMDDSLTKIEECIDSSLVQMGLGKNKIGVKSGGTGLTRAYIGGKRTIHRYNKRDLTWWT